MEKQFSRDSIKEFIVTCMWGIVMEKTHNIKSGWNTIFTIFKLAAQDDSKELVRISLKSMEKVIKNDFVFIEDNFAEIVACLIKFIQNEFEDYAFEGLELLNICAKHVDNELIDRYILNHMKPEDTQPGDIRDQVKKDLLLPIF